MLQLSNRRLLYQLILKSPGVHLRELQRVSGLSTGVLTYHLRYLEKKELICSQSNGYWKRYFVRAEVPYFDRRLLPLIKLTTVRHIVIFLLSHQSATFQQILSNFKFTKGALSFHLKKLVRSGIVRCIQTGRKKYYMITDKDMVVNLLLTYRATLSDTLVDKFVDMWFNL